MELIRDLNTVRAEARFLSAYLYFELFKRYGDVPLITEKLDIIENIQRIVNELNEKRNKTILRLYKNIYRLKKAFPAIDTEEIREVLNRKIELKNLVRNKNDKNQQKNT